jgi:hypothetical protein
MVMFLSCFPSRDFRRLLISWQKSTHPVELVEVFGLTMEAGDSQVASGPSEITSQGNQAGQSGCCRLDNTIEFDADVGMAPDIRRPIRYLAGLVV